MSERLHGSRFHEIWASPITGLTPIQRSALGYVEDGCVSPFEPHDNTTNSLLRRGLIRATAGKPPWAPRFLYRIGRP